MHGKNKMKHRLIALSILWIGSVAGQVTPHVITFFIRPIPEPKKEALEAAAARQKKPAGVGKILKTIVHKTLTFLNSGIYVSYAGGVATTDVDGQVMFERKTPELKLRVLITEDIKAVPVDPLIHKTLYGFVIDPKAYAQQYLFERLQDPETELYEWHVSQISVPKAKIIPYDTIIIFANPKHLIAPIGKTNTIYSENFVLPDFFTTESHNPVANAFRFLKIRHYFAPVKFDYKFFPEEYQQKIRS